MKNLKVFACLTAVLFTGMTVASCGSSTPGAEPKPDITDAIE